MKWSEVLSVVSSVASITGMSLFSAGTLLQPESPRQIAWMVATAICAAMVSIGCLTGVVQVLLLGDRAYLRDVEPSIRFMYWCFLGAISIIISVMFLFGVWYGLQDAWGLKIP